MAQSARNFDARVRHKRRLKRRLIGYGRFALCVAGVLLLSLGIVKIAGHGKEDKPGAASSAAISDAGEAILAPLPMQGGTTVAVQTGSYGPTQQTAGAYTLLAYDAAAIQLKERGQVSLDYFSDAAFIGDSLTAGFTDYKTNLSGALVCGYVGIGPDAIVNRSSVTHAERGSEIVLDVLAASQPKKVYVLLGTNTLVNTGSDDKFLAYYSQMLDDLRTTVGPDAIIYVQSVPPVRPEVAAEKQGLASSHLQEINAQLAAMADEKGDCYLNLWEAMADTDGNLNEGYAAADGIHFTAGSGYTAWVNYLRSHTQYAADNEWTPGTAFAG